MRIVLHIGTEKTATTSIQRYLFANRNAFAEKGVLYPDKLGAENQLCLPAWAIGKPDADEVTATAYGVMRRSGYDQMDRYILETLERQISATDPDVIVFSNEHLHSRVRSLGQVRRLKQILSQLSDDIQIILYIRRQDRLAVSYFSTPYKFGEKTTVGQAIPAASKGVPHYYDYGKLVTLWSEVFGAENLVVKIFEEEVRSEGGVVASFLNAAGLPRQADTMAKVHNESLSMEAIMFLASFNEQIAALPDQKAELRKIRMSLVRFLERNYPARRKLASKEAAMDFYSRCHASNEIVLKTFFPDRTKLFDENFNEYGDEESLAPDTQMLAEIGARAAMVIRDKLTA